MKLAGVLKSLSAALVLLVSSAHAAPALAREIEDAVELLLASIRAETSAREQFEHQVKTGALDPQERRDYEVYLDRLARMVEENRARLMALSHEVDAGAVAPGGASLGAEDPPTTDERVAALDADLHASLSEFDELLLDEMERVHRQSEPPAEAHSAESATGGGAQGGQSAQGGEGESAASEAGETGSGGEAGADSGTVAGSAEAGDAGTEPGATGRAGSRNGGEAAGAGASTGGGTGGGTPADIADASDDDVVARQLREAAERETDPALKERLWEEYRRYKRGARTTGGEGR